jgi:L-threonylcarbamoyladenylate synthase
MDFTRYDILYKMIKKAAKILKSGEVIAFPTETVFGIGAALDQPEAIKKIFTLKKRSRKKPLQILIRNMRQAKKLGKFNKQALELAKEWPGPLTLVIYKTRKVPKLVTGGSKKVGLRMPDHRTILNLIKKCGPIVATSANIAGKKPALTAKQIKLDVDYILNGKVKTGKASKVIDATKKLKTLRD